MYAPHNGHCNRPGFVVYNGMAHKLQITALSEPVGPWFKLEAKHPDTAMREATDLCRDLQKNFPCIDGFRFFDGNPQCFVLTVRVPIKKELQHA